MGLLAIRRCRNFKRSLDIYLMSIRSFAICSLAVGVIVSCASRYTVQPISIYTSVETGQCQAAETLKTDRLIEQSKGETILVCKAPGEHQLYLVDDGTRSWYALETPEQLVSFEKEIVYEATVGNFPNVAVDGTVEWRLSSKREVLGLIFRVHYQISAPEDGRLSSTSRLFVVEMRSQKPHVLSIVKDNHTARKILDEYLGK